MRNIFKGAAALIAISMLAVGANAKPPKTMVCPMCHMTMTRTKTKAAPVAVKTKNGTFYCCTACGKKKK